MLITKGTTIYLSTMGARGFIYPKNIPTVCTEDTEAKPLNFGGAPGKEAYLASARIISLQEEENLVIWIDKR